LVACTEEEQAESKRKEAGRATDGVTLSALRFCESQAQRRIDKRHREEVKRRPVKVERKG